MSSSVKVFKNQKHIRIMSTLLTKITLQPLTELEICTIKSIKAVCFN